MKKVLTLLLSCACCSLTSAKEWKDLTNLPRPARYESFEDGVPKTWTLQGQGKLSLNPWHYKLGKKSLQWDFKAGDVIRINNTIGDIGWRGGLNNECVSTFGVWVYVEKPMTGKKLRFEFREGEKDGAYFDFPLNFKGWQCGMVTYKVHRLFKGRLSPETDNILIRAPKDSDGRVLIDLLVYNGPRYSSYVALPNQRPWHPPEIDAKKYPVPSEVSSGDTDAIARIKNEFLTKINITSKGGGEVYYNAAMKTIEDLNIVEDSHGIRGAPIQIPRAHSGGAIGFYTSVGIPENKLRWYNKEIIMGSGHSKPALDETVNAVFYGISKEQYENISRANAKLWKYLIDQGFNTSYGYRYYYSGTYEKTIMGVYVVRDAIFNSGIMDKIFQYAQYSNYPLFPNHSRHCVSMDYFGGIRVLFYLAFLYSNDECRQVQVLRALTDRLNSEIAEDHGTFGFKPDGCGYHVQHFEVDYMQYGLRSLASLARVISNSTFALSDEAFNILKKVALCEYFYTNNLEVPIFMQGTEPFLRGAGEKYKLKFLPEILKNLALAGKSGCDRELAQAYVNLKPAILKMDQKRYQYDPVFEKKYDIEATAVLTGNISMPYGPLVAQRRKDWVAIASAGHIDMRDRGNHYAYHMGNGPLSILGRDGFFASGNRLAGWDWNRTNGATVLYMPDIASIKFVNTERPVPKGKEYLKKLMRRQYVTDSNHPIIKRGNGGISWRGVNGCFRQIFRGDRLYNDFGGIKSYFFIDDRIYALGSNIKSDNKKYQVQTNLYQKALKTQDDPTFVDGIKVTKFPEPDRKLDDKDPHYLVDSVGNGYYVPGGQALFVARKKQKSRNSCFKKHIDSSGDFASAWIDHGIAPENAGYEYVVLPYCDGNELAAFAQKASEGKAYKVLQKDADAHIIHDLTDGFYAGIFFKGAKVTNLPHVKNVERDCQIMYREKKTPGSGSTPQTILEVAVGDPDPHRRWAGKMIGGECGGKSNLTPLQITFGGEWKLATAVDGVKVLGVDKGETIIEFACIHGKSFNFTLISK